MARTDRFATFTQELSMNHLDTSFCRCQQCPGKTCTCGCQDRATHAPQAAAACTCPAGCGCEGAEAGCLCRTAPVAG